MNLPPLLTVGVGSYAGDSHNNGMGSQAVEAMVQEVGVVVGQAPEVRNHAELPRDHFGEAGAMVDLEAAAIVRSGRSHTQWAQ